MVEQSRRNVTYFVLFLIVTSRLCPEQGRKATVPHVCDTEAGGTYFLVYS